jgi:hypothetical protein
MVQLNAYGSALLIADMAYSDGRRKSGKSGGRSALMLLQIMRGNVVTRDSNVPKLTVEELRVKRWEEENEKRKFVLDFLRTNYPDKAYADKYEKENVWSKPLMVPTEESKRCEYLHEDGRHCTMKRDDTSCYTCCFVCYTPAMCAWTNCPLLPEDRKPASVV